MGVNRRGGSDIPVIGNRWIDSKNYINRFVQKRQNICIPNAENNLREGNQIMRTYLFFVWKYHQPRFDFLTLIWKSDSNNSIFDRNCCHLRHVVFFLASLEACWMHSICVTSSLEACCNSFFCVIPWESACQAENVRNPATKNSGIQKCSRSFCRKHFPRYGEWSIQVAVFNLLRLWSQTSCEGFWGQRIYNESIAKIRRKFWPQRFVSIASKTFLRSKETYPIKGDWTAVEQSRHTRF